MLFLKDNDTFDFIVVGAGTAGCVVANRLTEIEDFSVLVLEAGGNTPIEAMIAALFPFADDSHVDWRFKSQNDHYTAQAHREPRLNLIQGKMLGGSGGSSFMLAQRGNDRDYDRWAELAGDDTWNYENVLPYFIGLERMTDPVILDSPDIKYHGTEGNIGIQRFPHDSFVEGYLDAFGEAGNGIVLDLNSNKSVGYAQGMFHLTDGIRQTSAYGYLNTIKDRKNLFVKRHTLVTQIIIEDNKAIGVKALTKEGKTITLYARKEVIVSAGAINTPKLLMLSGIGPKDHLKDKDIEVIADLPVGRLLERTDIEVVWQTRKSFAPNILFVPTEFPLPVLVGNVPFNKSAQYPDYQSLLFAEQPKSLIWLIACDLIFTFEYSICKELYDAGATHDMFYANMGILKPKSTGTVRLKSQDPTDDPIVYLGSLSDDEDLERSADMLLDYNDALKSKYFKENGAQMVFPTLEDCDCMERGTKEYFKCYALKMMYTQYQYCGTAAMGMVVDKHLRVKGVKQLRAIDASVIPELPSALLFLSTVMIGEKGSDFIKEEYGYEKNYAKNHYRDGEGSSNGAPSGDLVTGLLRSNNALSLGKTLNKVNKVKDGATDGLVKTFRESLNKIATVGNKTLDLSKILEIPNMMSNFTAVSYTCYEFIMSMFDQDC